MKRIFIFAAFLFSTNLYGQTPIKNNSQNLTNSPIQKNLVTKQLLRRQVSYLDSLKMLKDTVTVSEIIGLSKLNFYSGTIYFAGTYFNNVVILKLNSKSNTEFNAYFARFAPGSKLVFDNVTWSDKDGVIIGPLSKLFILQ